MDCGDYANEAIEREISELLVVLATVKACAEKATAGTRTMGEAVGGILAFQDPPWGQNT